MLTVRQNFPDRRIADIPGTVARELGGMAGGLKPGARIAIGVGSRGIANIAAIVRSVVDHFKSQGFQPFMFPSMGSHGAATAEGQADVLAHYGIERNTMGCPVVSALDVVSLGSRRRMASKPSWTATRFRADGGLSGRPREVAHRFRGHDRERTVQDDGDRPGQVRGRAALPHVCVPAGSRTCDPHGGPGGAEERARFWAAWRFSKTPITIPRNSPPCRWSEMERKEEELLALVKSWMGAHSAWR